MSTMSHATSAPGVGMKRVWKVLACLSTDRNIGWTAETALVVTVRTGLTGVNPDHPGFTHLGRPLQG